MWHGKLNPRYLRQLLLFCCYILKQDYNIASYPLTPWRHYSTAFIKYRESLNENTFKALRLLTFLNVARFLNLNPLSSTELNLKVKTACNRRYVNKHLEKMFRSAANRPRWKHSLLRRLFLSFTLFSPRPYSPLFAPATQATRSKN